MKAPLPVRLRWRNHPNEKLRRARYYRGGKAVPCGPMLAPDVALRLQPRWAKHGYDEAWVVDWRARW